MSNKKVRRQKEDEATAFAFQEFLETFQNPTSISKTFIQAGVYNPGNNQLNNGSDEKGKIYAPALMYKTSEVTQKALECARLLKDNSKKPLKSNLEELKEEIEQRHKYTCSTNDVLPINTTPAQIVASNPRKNINDYDLHVMENTTNLFLTNLSSNLKEQDLMQIFGVYGPLASVKIMWPRLAERSNGLNVGFVAFMSRKDCKRAFYGLGNRTDMKLSWGKPIDIPQQPVYIPPEMVIKMLPPPYSGLPFNAQTSLKCGGNKLRDVKDLSLIDLSKTFVKVTIPLDKKVVLAIHRTIEFVIREGTFMEALIMRRELRNPVYQFMVDFKSSAHVYYRWKLFSLLNGESIYVWNTKPFRMFVGGSIWIPPTIPDFTKGMDVKLVDSDDEKKTKHLLDCDQVTLIHLIQNLTLQKHKVGLAMIFCIDNMAAAKDVVNILTESFTVDCDKLKLSTDLVIVERAMKQLARLYLVSDILYNAKLKNNSEYLELFKVKIFDIFQALVDGFNVYTVKINSLGNNFKFKVEKILQAWKIWRLFSQELVTQLKDKLNNENIEVKSTPVNEGVLVIEQHVENLEELEKLRLEKYFQDNFVKSKWETQSPEALQAQAMSTAKLHEIEVQRKYEEELKKQKELAQLEKLSGAKKTVYNLNYEDLRKIEIKVIRYQDNLESGKRKLKYALTVEDEICEYRERCIKKMKIKKQK